MCPEIGRRFERINLALLPPVSLVAGGMVLGVVNGAERHGELVADFQPKSARLRIANVVRLRWGPPANQTGLSGDKAQMFL